VKKYLLVFLAFALIVLAILNSHRPGWFDNKPVQAGRVTPLEVNNP